MITIKIIINIPSEFESDYNTDKFKDFFSRVAADIDYNGLCGRYEKETAEMFREAFENVEEDIIFVNDEHERFYYEKLQKVGYRSVRHKAFCYCLGISRETRSHFNQIYHMGTDCINVECLHADWQTNESARVVRMSFNLFCSCIPSLCLYDESSKQLAECEKYSVEDLFSCNYAPYFWQALQIRFPKYTDLEGNVSWLSYC